MARRKKSSGFEDMVAMVAWMPWWAGVALALASYLLFHALAKTPPGKVDPGKMGEQLQTLLVAAWSMWLQYLVPLICLLGAAISFFKRRKRKHLVDEMANTPDASALNGISWREFEMLVGEAFRLQGFTVAENEGAGPDGGVDLELRKAGQTFLVQCKQWKSYTVDVKVVRELYGVIASHKAAGGFVITSGSFTQPAKEFAKGKWLHLIDGPQLHEMIRRARAAKPGSGTSPITAAAAATIPPAVAAGCPLCGSPMVERKASRGPKAGAKFLGCSRFPACRGTRQSSAPSAG